MKRFAFRLAAALVTAATGVTVVALLPSRRPPEPKQLASRLQPPAPARPDTSPTPEEDEPHRLDDIYVTSPKWSYAGYDIERTYDDATGQSTATIRKGGKVVAKHEDGWMGEDSTLAGLFSFLGGGTKQLVVMQYSGGAHCCWSYHIYDFNPRLRLIYDGDEYDAESVGYTLRPKDLDGDGRFEFTRAVMAFDYFHMSHAASVFPVAVFAYDERAGKYRPANRKFADYVMRGLEGDVGRVAEERAKVRPGGAPANEGFISSVLQVTLKYVYAGREAEGLEFFEREYNLADKAEIKADMLKALKGDLVHQSLYGGQRAKKPSKTAAR